MKILNGCLLEQSRFHHGNVTVEIEAAPDLDALLTDDTDPERIPYWAVAWPSAPILARWLLDERDWHGLPVLELGCGTGLLGLSLASAGARVLQTDRFSESASLARSNARSNGLSTIRHAAAAWSHWPFRSQWPVIVGSDLLYERPSHAQLLQVLDRALSPGGTAYLADPARPMSANFTALATAAGWTVETSPIGVDLHILRR